MSYVERVLRPDEQIIGIGKMHWIIYSRGVALVAAGLAMLLVTPDGGLDFFLNFAGYTACLFGLVSIGRAWIEQFTTEVAVTNKRVIHKRGLIRRQTGEMNMDKVESVQVEQSILGRILDYGTIDVLGTGSGIEGLYHISHPLELRSAIVVK
jgi:uncharacterized membrane protein YdbT with pleckstrin-like domain